MEPVTILLWLAFSFIIFSSGLIAGQFIESRRNIKRIAELEEKRQKEKKRSDMLMSVCDLIK